jgi:hypothetical protein
MAHTFDIRFAKSEGVAALFEAPVNRHRWKGAGRLSIDPGGISIAVKRGLLNFFSRRSRRFTSDSLTEVYREGNSLRLVFSTPGSSEVLPIWAEEGDSAAEIVKLLPTRHTVELEHAIETGRRYRVDWRVVAVLPTVTIALTSLWLALPVDIDPPANESALPASVNEARPPILVQNPQTSPASNEMLDLHLPGAAQTIERNTSNEYADDGSIAAFPAPLDEDGSAAPAPPASAPARAPSNEITTPAVDFEIGNREFSVFSAELNRLRSDYLYLRDHPTVARLRVLEQRWWQVTERIHNTPGFDSPLFLAQRERELAISRAWRHYLAGHAAALNGRAAYDYRDWLAFAESLSSDYALYRP